MFSLSTLSAASPLVPLTIAIFKYSKIRIEYNYIFYFLCFAIFTETATRIIHKLWLENIYPLAHIYVALELIFFAFFYHKQLNNFIQKKYIFIAALAFILFSVINVFFLNGIESYPTITRSIESLILVSFSILFYSQVMIESKIEKLSKAPMIWINTAVLFYFSANLFFHAFFSLIFKISVEVSIYIGYFFKVLNLLFYLLVAVGFLKVSQKQDGKSGF